MGRLPSLLRPLKKAWLRLHSAQRKSRGIYVLYEDVKSCQYDDVHVLWSILVESHPPPAVPPPPPLKPGQKASSPVLPPAKK
ncbi:hypothetical protein Taro_015798 [Colocasia esculenta]|uniref:Uncharacterized protein n=1 Tax=Colocasia esculenta TaxID=4460 RepID=A0A843UC89_COLES|nr:hypothetical protein [Colocasia esculenta]